MGWQSPEPAVLMDHSGGHRRGMTPVLACCGAGLALVAVAVVGVVGGAPSTVALGVFGVLLIGLGLLPLLTRRTWNRPRRLIAEPAGVRWEDRYGTPWMVPWSDLGEVAIVATDKAISSNDGAGSQLITLVSLELTPHEDGFPERHPEMARFWQRRGGYRSYRVGMRDGQHDIVVADQALRSYAPAIYRGIVHENDPRLSR